MAKNSPTLQTQSAPVPPNSFPAVEWDKPVSLSTKGEPITLRQSMQGGEADRPFTDLTQEELVQLAARRIESRPDFDLVILGFGRIDKARALAHVRAQTPIGQHLVDIERRIIRYVQARASMNISPAS
jgi:hypothetical protein